MAYLSSHPNIFVCDPKEPNYWSKELPLADSAEQAATWTGYMRFFSDAEECHIARIDGSTTYCWSAYAVPDILRELPDSKFIFMIRNPVALAPSLHSEELLSGHEDITDYNEA